MTEPRALAAARRCLARAEAAYRSAEGLRELEAGLALLDDVMAGGAAQHRVVAENLAATYAVRIYTRIEQLVGGDPGLPETELEHFFKLLLAFDQSNAALPEALRALKIAVARSLIERYYEGHPPELKQRALEQLAGLEAGKGG